MKKNNILPILCLMIGIVLVELSRHIEWLSKVLDIVGTIILGIAAISIIMAVIYQIKKRKKK